MITIISNIDSKHEPSPGNPAAETARQTSPLAVARANFWKCKVWNASGQVYY